MKPHLALVAGLVCAMAPDARACSCMMPGSVPEELARSETAFVGRVVRIEPDASPANAHPAKSTVTFAVYETFKGATSAQVNVTTNRDSASCGYPFEQGEVYVVYAHHRPGGLGAGLCSRTGPAADRRSGLQVLREGVR